MLSYSVRCVAVWGVCNARDDGVQRCVVLLAMVRRDSALHARVARGTMGCCAAWCCGVMLDSERHDAPPRFELRRHAVRYAFTRRCAACRTMRDVGRRGHHVHGEVVPTHTLDLPGDQCGATNTQHLGNQHTSMMHTVRMPTTRWGFGLRPATWLARRYV